MGNNKGGANIPRKSGTILSRDTELLSVAQVHAKKNEQRDSVKLEVVIDSKTKILVHPTIYQEKGPDKLREEYLERIRISKANKQRFDC